MNKNSRIKSIKHLAFGTSLALSTALMCTTAQATIVQFDTVLGPINVNLYDETTPQTVANFLTYVEAGSYTSNIFHRSETNFVLQGGGYEYTANGVVSIESNASVTNEPVYSNVRGSIAMAKLPNLPNSATNQWFFNLADNGTSQQLDFSNGGYTVFGEVADEESMTVLEQIAELPHNFGFASPFASLPLRDYDASANQDPDETNFIIINQITVLDASVDTAANLTPPLNPGPPDEPETSSSGGGTIGGILIGLLGLINLRRLRKQSNSSNP
jgi:cyclophilin family peptidyl-prolyl cis-trans isomerase